jgi:transcriptional regulator with GAF, ATPase, and Fis domain
VDCFDAVREERQYRKGMRREQAIELLIKGSGAQYDPNVVGTFIAHLAEFESEIAAHQGAPVPTFGIEPAERLSEAALKVAPAAGLAEERSQSEQKSCLQDSMSALFELSESLIKADGQSEVFSALAEKLLVLVPADLCIVTFVTPGTGDNVVVHATGHQADLVLGRNRALGEGVTGWVIVNGKPFYNVDPKLDFPDTMSVEFSSYRTLAAYPMIKDNQIIGAVSLYSATINEFSADQLKLIEGAVNLGAMVLPNASNATTHIKQQSNAERVSSEATIN